MAAEEPFPVMELDLLAYDEVLRHLSPVQLFEFSLISKDTTLHAKEIIRRCGKGFTLGMHLDERFSLKMYFETDPTFFPNEMIYANMSEVEDSPLELTDEVYNGIPYKHFARKVIMKTFWDDEKTALQTFLVHLLDLYQKPLKYLMVDCAHPHTLEMLKFLGPLQSMPLDLLFVEGPLTPEILENLPKFNDIMLKVTVDQEFQDKDTRIWEYGELQVNNASWITLPRLLTFNSQMVIVKGSRMTTDDVNMFLKLWIKGACPRMKFFKLTMRDLDVNWVFNGIDFHVPEHDQEEGITEVHLHRDNGWQARIRVKPLPAQEEDPDAHEEDPDAEEVNEDNFELTLQAITDVEHAEH